MNITKLSLTNFRSFGKTQTIDFASVTLLFGPNSVGKSSVLMALAYIHQILLKGQCDPMKLEVLGDKYVGGFKRLVHGRDLSKSIIIKIEYSKAEVGHSYAYLMDIMGEQFDWHMRSASIDAERAAIEVEVSWSEVANTAFVSRYTVWLDDEEVAELLSDSGMKQPIISKLNYFHPLLLPDNHEDWLIELMDGQYPTHPTLVEKAFSLKGITLPTYRDISKGAEDIISDIENDPDNLMTFTNEGFVSEFHELLNSNVSILKEKNNASYLVEMMGGQYTFLHEPISFKGFVGALPKLGKMISTSKVFDDDKLNSIVNEILSDCLVAPLDNLLSVLNDGIFIGPLRTVPDLTYQANPYPQAKDWHNGLAAWDLLANADVKLLKLVDDWMSSKTKLDLGYGIAIKVEKKYAEFKAVKSVDSYSRAESQLNKMILDSTEVPFKKVDFDERSTDYQYSIWDKENHIDVSPNEIGVGVSQLLPFIVAVLSSRKGVVAIEQPELHVHPRVQVAIGDLLTQMNKQTNYLVETHSEHLILRILKRISQTEAKELPKGYSGVNKEDISIVYLCPSECGVKAMRIGVDGEGEFTSKWPGGFFAERAEELF